jgi:hypothetical protein
MFLICTPESRNQSISASGVATIMHAFVLLFKSHFHHSYSDRLLLLLLLLRLLRNRTQPAVWLLASPGEWRRGTKEALCRRSNQEGKRSRRFHFLFLCKQLRDCRRWRWEKSLTRLRVNILYSKAQPHDWRFGSQVRKWRNNWMLTPVLLLELQTIFSRLPELQVPSLSHFLP